MTLLILSEETLDRELKANPRETDLTTALEKQAVMVISKDGLGYCLEGYSGMLDDHDADLGPYGNSTRAETITRIANRPSEVWFTFTAADAVKLREILRNVKITDEDVENYFGDLEEARDDVRAVHEIFKKSLSDLKSGQVLLLRIPH